MHREGGNLPEITHLLSGRQSQALSSEALVPEVKC